MELKLLNKIILFVAVFSLFSGNAVNLVPVFADDEDEYEKGDFEAPHISNEIIISFKPGVTLDEIEDFYDDFFNDYEISEKEEFDDDEEDDDPEERLISISVPATREILQILRSDPRVDYTEYNYIVTIDAIPNDSSFNQLWGLHNTGQNAGTVDADIDAPEAWDITTGSPNVIIGVIDTGIDYNHPDLSSNVWTNPGETGLDANNNDKRNNGVDDDGNGYVDDVHGINLINPLLPSGDPLDDNGHGTHVSGTIGAKGDNSGGVAGVNWNVSIAACKFLDASGSGSTTDAIKCFDYFTNLRAAGNNVLITSNSWGGGGFSQSLEDSMTVFPGLHIAAAGNSNVDNDLTPHYPSSYNLENIIAVAATDRNDAIASFSNWGATSVDIAAPGVDTYSTTPSNSYGSKSGTSMATPHVAGAAGLVWASNPSLSASQVKQHLLSYGDSISNVGGNSGKPTFTNDRLNVFNSLNPEIDTTPPSPITDLAVPGSGFSSVILTWTATGDDGLIGTASSYDVRYSTSSISDANWNTATQATGEPAPQPSGSSETFTASGLSPGTEYYFALKVKDNLQNESGLSNVVTGITAISETTAFNDNMENGVNGWTAAGTTGLWHLSSLRSVSPSTSWYYGDDITKNYDFGENSGTLTSPTISLAGAIDAILTFYELSDVESFTNFDRTRVQVSTDGSTWQTIFESHGTLNAFDQPEWLKRTVDLTPYVGGDIYLRFWFDTVDPIANTFEGWYIDDVKVEITPSGPPPPPNNPPFANDDAYTTNEDTSLTVTAIDGVLFNDTDSDSDPLTAIIDSAPLNGSIVLNPDGSFSYTPNTDFNGVDTYTYRASDGITNSNAATVSITINPVSDPPLANAGVDQTVTSETLVILDGSGSDPDGDPITFSWTQTSGPIVTLSNPNLANPTFDAPSVAATTSLFFDLVVSDGTGESATDSVVITVNPLPPPTESSILTVVDGYDQKNSATLKEMGKTNVVQASDNDWWETEFGFYTSYELSNENIPIGSTIVSAVIYVEHFEEEGFSNNSLEWKVGSWGTTNPLVRQGENNEFTDSWDVTSIVDTPEKINSMELLIKNNDNVEERKTLVDHIYAEVTWSTGPPPNQSPTANAGSDQTVSDADGNNSETVTLNGSGSDSDGSISSYEWKEGTTVLGTTPTISPSLNVGIHTITLTVTDNGGATGTDTVVVTVNANQSPTANAGSDQTVSDADGNNSETVTLNGSGSDSDGSISSYEWKEGTTVLGTTPTISPSLNVGIHTITLTVTDNGGATGTDTVVVTVNANQSPTANAGSDQTVSDADGNNSETVTLNGSGSDSDGSISSYEWKEGTTVLGTTPTISPSLNVGIHTITLTVTDNGGATGTDTVVVTVNAAPPGPTLDSIIVTPTNPSITVDSTQQFTAMGSYSDGSTLDITNTVEWTSTDTAVAVISVTGLANTLSAGTTTIMATSGAVVGSTTLTATSEPADIVTILVAEYEEADAILVVEATSTDPNAVLTVEGYGDMINEGSGEYVLELEGVENPGASITVTSSSGGSDTYTVLYSSSD